MCFLLEYTAIYRMKISHYKGDFIIKVDEFHNLFRILIISFHIYGYFYKLILSSNGVCFISVMQRALTNIYDNKGSFEQLS